MEIISWADMEQAQAASDPLEKEKLIIVTGFGPFVGHEDVNASWEAVQLLSDSLDYKGTTYHIEKLKVAVEYEAVDKVVEEIWTRKPELVIHCGVHGLADCIHVEKQAVNHRFNRPDYAGKQLPSCTARLTNYDQSKDKFIRCQFNVDRIIETIKKSCQCTPTDATDAPTTAIAKASYNVGEYLCCYIYLKSLDKDSGRTLFVHVPPVDKPLSSSQTAEVLMQIISECVRQLNEDMKRCTEEEK